MKTKLIKYILIIVVATSTSLYANFADTYGFSAKGVSRGNAVTATVNDWSSVYYNMSGLGKTVKKKETSKEIVKKINKKKRRRSRKKTVVVENKDTKQLNDEFAISYMYTYPIMKIDSSGNLPDGGLNFGTTTIGLVLDLNHFVIMPKDIVSSARFGLGLGLMQDGTLVKLNDVDLRAHNYMRYGREAQRAVILAGAGFGFLNDMFGFGVGANIWTKGEGKVEMKNLELSPTEQVPTQQVMMDLKPDIAPSGGIYFSPGKLFSVVEGLEWGVNYRGELYMDLPLQTNASMSLAGIDLELGLYILDYYTPHTITTGLAYTITDKHFSFMNDLTITLDFEYQMWSRFKVSKAKEVFISNYNKNNGTDPDIEMLAFKDVYVPKIGFSYDVFSWLDVNLGYFYRTSFLDDKANDTIFNFLDNATHVGSLGFGFIIPKMGPMVSPIEINLSGQFQYLVKKDVEKETFFITAENPVYSYSGMVPSVMLEVIMRW